jgi:hypothetical protein
MSGEIHAPALYPRVPIKNGWLGFIFYTFWVKENIPCPYRDSENDHSVYQLAAE